MDIDIKNIIANDVKKEADEFMKFCEKITKLAPKANTKRKKETVNKYIDQAQRHYDNMHSLLKKSITLVNESNEKLYEDIIANTDPNVNIQQIKKMEMFEHMGKFKKLIIEEDK